MFWKRYKIGALLLWNPNRKSEVRVTVTVPMTLGDLERQDMKTHFPCGTLYIYMLLLFDRQQ